MGIFQYSSECLSEESFFIFYFFSAISFIRSYISSVRSIRLVCLSVCLSVCLRRDQCSILRLFSPSSRSPRLLSLDQRRRRRGWDFPFTELRPMTSSSSSSTPSCLGDESMRWQWCCCRCCCLSLYMCVHTYVHIPPPYILLGAS